MKVYAKQEFEGIHRCLAGQIEPSDQSIST